MKFIKSTKYSLFVAVFGLVIWLFGINDINYNGLPLILLGSGIYFYHLKLMGPNWSTKVETKKQVITKGLFKYIRHPLYFGMFLVLIGIIISTLNLLLLFVFIFINFPYYFIRALAEEKEMSRYKDYKSYMKNTGMFLPKVTLK